MKWSYEVNSTTNLRRRIDDLGWDDIEVIGEYINHTTLIEFRSSLCDHGSFYKTTRSLLAGYTCPKCHKPRKTYLNYKSIEVGSKFNYKVNSTENLKRRIDDLNLPIKVLGEFNGSSVKIKFNKNTCEHEPFLMTPNNLISKLQDCPKCSSVRRTNTKRRNSPITIVSIKDEMNEIYPSNTYSLVEGQEYINNKRKLNVLCHSCDNIFGISLVNMRSGRQCPVCSAGNNNRGMSNGSRQIYDYLKENNIPFEYEFKFDDCVDKKPLRFDFAIRRKDESLLLIEYDGRQHYTHISLMSEDEFKALQRRDRIKDTYCRENNIELHRIRYDDPRDIGKILDTIVNGIT